MYTNGRAYNFIHRKQAFNHNSLLMSIIESYVETKLEKMCKI